MKPCNSLRPLATREALSEWLSPGLRLRSAAVCAAPAAARGTHERDSKIPRSLLGVAAAAGLRHSRAPVALSRFATFALGLCLLLTSSVLRAETFNVLAYGADATGRNWSTGPVQKAINDCTLAGGGIVAFPPGRYRLAPVMIKNNVTLQFAKETFLDAPRLFSQYAGNTSFLIASNVINVALRGPVVIDGQGLSYWQVLPNPTTNYLASQSRPVPLINFRGCSNVVVDGLTVVNSPSWTFTSFSSTNVTFRNVTIANDFFGPNTDGINLCQTKNALVTGCRITTGDDAITVKNLATASAENSSRNIVITNCDLTGPRARFKIGSESRIGVIENILFTDCRMRGTTATVGMLAGIALECMDGATVRNIHVQRITCENARSPIFIRLGNRGSGQTARPTIPGSMQNILIEDVTATGPPTESELGIQIHGIPSASVTNIVLRNITLISRGGVSFADLGVTDVAQMVVPELEASHPYVDLFVRLPSYGVYCRHARGVTLQNIQILPLNPDVRPALVFDDVSGLVVRNLVTSFPGIELRSGPSLSFVTNSPTITVNAVPNPAAPPGGWILATP